MRNHFIIFIFIFIINCSFDENAFNVIDNDISDNKINISKENSFEEYVNLLLDNNKSKSYPDINNTPD
tara:strand:+ start:420 stop:623 length:204 start_codon:yes stop_codon:yes gene_type:complete